MRRAIAIMLFVLAAAGALSWWLQFAEPRGERPPTDHLPAAPATPAVSELSAAPASEPVSPRADAMTPDAVRAAAAKAADEQRLRVLVVDADQQPIEGAEIETFEDSTPGHVRTDRDGIALLPGPIRGDARRLLVRAGNRHYQAYWQFRPDLTITLPWYGPVRGRVVDRTSGTAIPGVVVTRHHNFCKHCEPDRATTDGNGAFEMPAVPRDENCVFVFAADGYANQCERLRIPGTGDAIAHTFALRRGAVVTGRCIDLATKQVLAGARVVNGGETIATTAADGSFRTLVLPDDDDTIGLRFESGGHCRVTFLIKTPQLDPSFEYPLPRAATITGRVMTPTAAPVVGARVNPIVNGAGDAIPGMPADCRVEDEDYGLQALTDAAGAFTVGGLVPGGKYRVRASHADFEPPKDDRRWGALVELKDGMPPLELVLVPKSPANATGTLVGTFRCNGALREASLHWRQGAHDGGLAVDSQGRFSNERVPAGRVEVTVVPKPFEDAIDAVRDAVAWRGTVDVVAGEEVRLDIVHEFVEATIAGRVVYADGAPAAGRYLWASGDNVRLFEKSGDDGRYVLRLAPAIARVKIGCDGAAGGEREAQPGATGIDFVVARRGTLRARMRHADGSFAEADIARLSDNSFALLGLVPARDPDGWVLMPIDEGTHTLLFFEKGYVPEVRPVTVAGTTSLEVEFARGVDATLRLRPGSELPPANFVVRVVDAALAPFEPTATDSLWRLEGRRVPLTPEGATIKALGPGTHRLFARDPAFEVEPATFPVDTTPVTIDLTWRRRAK